MAIKKPDEDTKYVGDYITPSAIKAQDHPRARKPKVQKPAKKGTVPTKVIKDAVKKVVSERKTIAKRTRKPKVKEVVVTGLTDENLIYLKELADDRFTPSVNNVVESDTGNINASYPSLEDLLFAEREELKAEIAELHNALIWGQKNSVIMEEQIVILRGMVTRLSNKSLWQRIKDVFCYE